MSQIELGNGIAHVNNGQLVSFLYRNNQIMHIAEKADKTKEETEFWNHTEALGTWEYSGFEMLPIIGQYPNGDGIFNGVEFSLGNHGISRALDYIDKRIKQNKWVGTQIHNGSPIAHPKDPSRQVVWPYQFDLEKRLILANKSIRTEYKLSGDVQPYQFGAHPAFKGPEKPEYGEFTFNNRTISLEYIMDKIQDKAPSMDSSMHFSSRSSAL